MFQRAFSFCFFFVLLGYIVFCAFMYQKQRIIQYNPIQEKFSPEQTGIKNVEYAHVVTEDGLALEGWYVPAQEQQKTIVFFHGNGQIIGSSVIGPAFFLQYGYGVLFVEYRGYAGHQGQVTENGLYKDAYAFVQWLHEEQRVNFSDMIVYGESLGSALALKMAVEFDVSGVVLLASFSSILDIVSDVYWYLPVRLLLKDKFMNDELIQKVDEPILIVHGRKDKIVPFKYGKQLHAVANGNAQFISVDEGHHNNLYEFDVSNNIKKFLDGL